MDQRELPALKNSVYVTPSTARYGGRSGSHGFLPEPPKDMPGGSWSWCMRGRPQLPSAGDGLAAPQRMQLVKSQSLPMSMTGTSMLVGNLGAEPSPFHGVFSRRFGRQNDWDPLMRGSKLAHEGWAGTWPEKDARIMGHNSRA
eukprot:TRINITY_DN33723_c0_g1_i1.p1 TRINITY_DN33723_c0_g1~~TRINITY_DN33723_c0_g1_i1.p1  ORF type:complete len:167 (+),score=23.86 TRINITY_DN33723_c0_g1_i1:73-501(+)